MPSHTRTHRSSSHRGLTIVDVLVTLVVITVLIGLLLPVLGPIRESARRVVCQSNQRQLGVGMLLYANDNDDRLVASTFLSGQDQVGIQPWETMVLYSSLELQSRNNGLLVPVGWDGLGSLYKDRFITTPEVFYCPSHSGEHEFETYEANWANGRDAIYGNFQYRGAFGLDRRRVPRLSRLNPGISIAADGFRTLPDINHEFGLNALYADLSVAWKPDGNQQIAAFLMQFGNMVPDTTLNTTDLFEQIWQDLDQNGPPLN